MLPDKLDVYLADDNSAYAGTPLVRPHVLILKREYCWKIHSHQTTSQQDFPAGYIISLRNNIEKLPPEFPVPGPRRSGAVWRVGYKGKAEDLVLSADRLLVMHFDLQAFLQQHGKHIVINERETQHDRELGELTLVISPSEAVQATDKVTSPEFEFTPQRYTSKKLLALWEAALLWEGVDPSDTEAHLLTDEKVYQYLYKSYKSDKLAKAGSKIIKPKYARPGLEDDENPVQERQFITDEFKVLVAASEHFWSKIDFRVEHKFPENDDVEKWLKAEHKWCKAYLREAAAKIIRHHDAPSGRPTLRRPHST